MLKIGCFQQSLFIFLRRFHQFLIIIQNKKPSFEGKSPKKECYIIIIMEIDISTPALLFSAISLLILAYTNRFLALASLIRQYIGLYKEHHEERILKQIHNFDVRLKVIKMTQIFGVISFLFCVLCMFLIFINLIIPPEILFAFSLICLFISLLLSLKELFMSIGALNVELEDIKTEISKT